MIVLGITGSIGMGKSTVAAQFASLGAKLCSADAIVHDLLAHDREVIAQVHAAFPEAVHAGAVNRAALGTLVFASDEKRNALERILHPCVVAAENRFIKEQRKLGAACVVLDIPLLFETGAEARCDKAVVVTAPFIIQYLRVMRRPGMSAAKFRAILSRQMPDKEKRARADFVIATWLGRKHSLRQVKCCMKELGLA